MIEIKSKEKNITVTMCADNPEAEVVERVDNTRDELIKAISAGMADFIKNVYIKETPLEIKKEDIYGISHKAMLKAIRIIEKEENEDE